MASPVLVVSSDPLFSHVLMKSLAREEISSRCTSSFIEAVNTAATARAAVVDLNFAGLDGNEIVRAISAASGVPILAMSEDDDAHVRSAALEAGAADAMGKAYLPDELVARVRRLLPTRTLAAAAA